MLVGDNRDRSNLGCRATSIALSDLLRDRIDVDTVIRGGTVERPLPAPGLPKPGVMRRVASIASHSSTGWRSAAALPLAMRPDIAMGEPAEVARGLRRLAARDEAVAQLVHDVETAEIVVVNGEGDLILTQPPRRKLVFLLAVIELAHQLGTPCAYVNAMVSDPPGGGRGDHVAAWARQALQRCRLVALRDEWSLDLARRLDLHAAPRWIPDALFTWHDLLPLELKDDALARQGWPFEGSPRLDLDDDPYVCLSGSSAYSGRGRRPPVSGYVDLVERLQAREVRVVLVEGAEADGFLREVAERTGAPLLPWATNIYVTGTILARSRVFISGRHHPTILAALGGSLPVMIGSNSHKNVSLQALLGIEAPREVDAALGPSAVDATFDQAMHAVRGHDDEARVALRARCGELAARAATLPDLIADALDAEGSAP
jgi:hypothetical protein